MRLITSILILIFTSITLFSQNEPITINISDLRSNDGQIVVLLYKKGQKFKLTSKPYKTIIFKNIKDNKAAFSFSIKEKGEYAYILYHDEDSNLEVNTNFIGMPKEGCGTSNNSGMPNYSKAKFYYDGKKQKHFIEIKYM